MPFRLGGSKHGWGQFLEQTDSLHIHFDGSSPKRTIKEAGLNRLQIEASFVIFELGVVKNARSWPIVGTVQGHVAEDWHDVPP